MSYSTRRTRKCAGRTSRPPAAASRHQPSVTAPPANRLIIGHWFHELMTFVTNRSQRLRSSASLWLLLTPLTTLCWRSPGPTATPVQQGRAAEQETSHHPSNSPHKHTHSPLRSQTRTMTMARDPFIHATSLEDSNMLQIRLYYELAKKKKAKRRLPAVHVGVLPRHHRAR